MNMTDVKKALQHGSKAGSGKRLLFIEGISSAKWDEIRTSPYYMSIMEEVKAAGERFLKSPIPTLPFSLYSIFDKTGSRKEFEREYFDRRARLNTFAILSMAYGKKEHIEALEDILWAICDEYTWSLPAHLGGNSLRVIENLNMGQPIDGNVRKSIREHYKIVDLFASETGFAVSEILYLLEDKLSELVVCRARKEVQKRILEPYCEMNEPFWWESCTNNWAAVCAGSVGAAAMYLIQDDAVLAPIITKLLGTVECFLSGYQEDGACTEGLGYWYYGFGFFTSFAQLLKQRTAGEIDLFASEKVKQIALFQQKCYLSENYVVSFSDGALKSSFRKGLIHFLKSEYPEVEIPDSKYAGGFHSDHCYRWTHNIRDLVWSQSSFEGSSFGDATYYLKDSQWFISRKRIRGNTVCLAAKAGHNDEPHNHNDVGNFILHVNGESLLTDTGAGEYTKDYFREKRYTYFCNGAQGHSVPVVEDCFQQAGRKYEGKILSVDTAEDEDLLVMDIAGAYDNSNLSSLVRQFQFVKTGDVTLTIKDSYIFEAIPKAVTERFVTFNKPEITGDGKVRVAGEKGAVNVVFDPERLDCAIHKHIFVNHAVIPMDIYTVELDVKSLEKNVEVEVVFKVDITQ